MVQPIIMLPACLTVEEFAFLVRRHPVHVRRLVRRGRVKSDGLVPMRIPSQELKKFGLDLDYCAKVYAARYPQDAQAA